jgi:hypothetical protein
MCAFGLAILRFWPPFAITIIGIALFLYGQRVHVKELRAMLANRPRSGSAAGLTHWTKHEDVTAADCYFPSGRQRAEVTHFFVWCDKPISMTGLVGMGTPCTTRVKATWYANPVDPGGGRYAGVCPSCGEGHYFLRIPG